MNAPVPPRSYLAPDLAGADVEAYLDRQQRQSLLRFITCGSVDDGKSTLIGRLLYDSRMVLDDQMAALESDSRRFGAQGGDLDFALLVDGLAAEREQGITIDVAYRFFATDRRKFVVADTPGHEQYTRNMVTGASTADAAVILVDARKGVLTQTRRHSYLVELVGIRNVVLAVNKMDLVDWSKDRFDAIVADYAAFARGIGVEAFQPIPVSGLKGDNVAGRSDRAPWYRGPSLIEHLERIPVDEDRLREKPLRLPVQWVNRPNLDFRGFAGRIAAGTVRPGDRVRISGSGRTTTVSQVQVSGSPADEAAAGQSVTLRLVDEVDCSRGDVIAAAGSPPEIADQFEATVIWMSDEPLLPGRSYLIKIGTRVVTGAVTAIKHRTDVNTLEPLAASTLALNEIGACNLGLDRAIAFDPYDDVPDMGGFILIDRQTNATVGAGLLRFALRRSHNVHWQALDVGKASRASAKGQKPAVLWFTGLSGAGKSTIANLVEKRLHADGRHTYLLDGDNLRHGLTRDLGFTDADRVENIRRVAETAKLMVDAGLIVLTSFISPFRAERRMARALMAKGEFFEVFVDTPLAVAEGRDVKGLYAKARAGQLKNFTGVDSPYEAPEAPEIVVGTDLEPADAADRIVAALRDAGVLSPPPETGLSEFGGGI